jgi:hypothetical protein
VVLFQKVLLVEVVVVLMQERQLTRVELEVLAEE